VFGPTPRAYDHYVPRQVRALAKKSAFNARAREGAIVVIDAFNFESPKTAAMLSLVARVDAADKKVLVLTDGVKQNVFLSGRNIPNVHVMPYSDSSTYHILWSDVVLVESNALGYELAAVEEKPHAAHPKSATKSRGAEKAERKTAKAATKSSNAHKTARRAAKAAGKSARPKAAKKTAKKSAGKKKGK
jgi:hypothetical protein